MQISNDCLQKEGIRRIKPSYTDPEYLVLSRLYMAISKMMLSISDKTLDLAIDYGCGSRPYDSLLKQSAKKVIGADLPGNPMADEIILPDGRIPLPNACADLVVSFQVLEHVPNPQKYLEEAHRLLRPGGRLILSTHGIWPYHPHPKDFFRWTHEGLSFELERTGFFVEKIRPVLSGFRAVLQLQFSLWRYMYWHSRYRRRIIKMIVLGFNLLVDIIDSKIPSMDQSVASVYLVCATKKAD